MKKQRLLSLLLAITMVVAMVPAFSLPAMAADVQIQTDLSDESIKDGDPVTVNGVKYTVIKTVEYLNDTLLKDDAVLNGNFILGADLDYSGKSFKRVMMDQGIFDGNGHKMYGYDLVDQDDGNGKGIGASTFGGINKKQLSADLGP